MKIKNTLFLLSALIASPLFSQHINRITGPLGVYDMTLGYCYQDSTGIDSIPIQTAFKFGELAITNQALYSHISFQTAIDSAMAWHPNKIFGIIQPPNEHGTPNQPGDTLLLNPFDVGGPLPGMIQGGQRFSRLSQLYSGFCGIIMDDWYGDTSITRNVHDAVKGKQVDADGTVHHESRATTPDNKLYAVMYSADAVPAALPYIDGVIFSIAVQNCCYLDMDSDISRVRVNFPNKDVIIAIFLDNSAIGGWADSTGVHYLLSHTLNRYDDGDINGITIFAAYYLLKNHISLDHWNGFALPHWLDSLYYPYLGEGMGKVYDCNSGNTLTDASIRVFCKGRLTGDTLMRSYQRSDTRGKYQCGLWAGNRNTDSTYYYLIAEKSGYITDTLGFWIHRQDTTHIPDIFLCPGINGSQDKITLYPNPTTGKCHIVISDKNPDPISITVCDKLGRHMAQSVTDSGFGEIDMTGWSQGIYFVKVGEYIKKVIKE